MEQIKAVELRCKQENIIISTCETPFKVVKNHYDLDGNFRKATVLDVRSKKLQNRRAETVQEYLENLVENHNYKVIV